MLAIPESNLSILKAEVPVGRRTDRAWLTSVALALALALFGIALRLWLPVGFHAVAFDEALYRNYVHQLDQAGVGNYDLVIQKYLVDQRLPDAKCQLPPTRFLYVYCAWLAKRAAFGDAGPVELRNVSSVEQDPALTSLRQVSRWFSIFLFLLSGIVAWRMFGREIAYLVLALMAVAPLQLHMGGHALIDGFFAFWAMLVLWSAWENLKHPNHRGWLSVYALALVCLVFTKESALFVYLAVGGLLALNRWLKFGHTTQLLTIVTLAAPVAAVLMLAQLSGGPGAFLEVNRIFIAKAQHLDYAILAQDGPWHRYLIDELVLSPMILCLAIGGIFSCARRERPLLFLAGFFALSYATMCEIPHGLNLRFATIWDLPLRALAAVQLLELSKMLPGRWTRHGLLAALVILCGYELWQYWLFFCKNSLYELPTQSLLQAVDILKS